MNDGRFQLVLEVKSFIFSIDSLLINFPRKDRELKNRIINDCYDILEYIYLANYKESGRREIQEKILAKLNMLDFYFEKSYKCGYISNKVCQNKCNHLLKINKMVRGWIKCDK